MQSGRVTRRQLRTHLSALAVGTLATALVVMLYASERLDRLEWLTYDWRCRQTNSMQTDPRILCIDIDDTAVARIGRWPWPRDLQAALLSIPSELGARRSLVDLTWSEAEFAALLTPANADVIEDVRQLDPQWFEAGRFPVTFPDLALATALRDAGSVAVAFEFRERDLYGSVEFEAAVQALAVGDEAAAREHIRARAAHRRQAPDQDEHEREAESEANVFAAARLAAAILRQPGLTESEAAARLGLDSDLVRHKFEDARAVAFRRLAREGLDSDGFTDPNALAARFAALHERVLGPYRGADTPQSRALALAMKEQLGLAPTLAKAAFPVAPDALRALRIEGVSPIYFRHALAADACGSVSFEPDADGVVRRLQLFARYGQHILGQLALRVACDELGVVREQIHMRGDEVVLPRAAGGELRLQLDSRGRTLVPWLREKHWIRQFTHISADDVIVLHEHRQQRIQNDRHARVLLREALARLGAGESEHAQTLATIRSFEAQADVFRVSGRTELLADISAALAVLLEAQPEIEAAAHAMQRAAQDAQPAREALDKLSEIDAVRRARPKLDAVITEYETRLRGFVAGKICLFGYTATSLADLKPIPTSRSAAGVMAHANLLNGLLSGRGVTWAGGAANGAIAMLLGLAASGLTTMLRPRTALPAVLLLLLGYVALALGLFYWRLYWLGLTPALLAAITSFVLISVYQFVFVDSDRRNLSRVLGQYTSARMARQMSENVELCQRAEEREVTAMFTDLRGFTTISEQIGAERTQRVLNVFLGRMTEVMLAHDAMVNKFIGDGIFAFWNPVIHTQPDHALRACETALDMLAALEALRAEQLAGQGDAAFAALELRVGVATGRAIVGPCGSEQKYDYTCIGDSVNVAARLESGNKFYGTRILVSGGTQAQTGDRFAFRYLGGVQAKGKTLAVPIYELLGRRGQVAPQLLDYAETFARAVALFQQRQWTQALEAFGHCAALRGDDDAARNYVEISANYLVRPPAEDWNGAIELREK